jgi:cytochrome b subunit of formate dehydrogenase
MQINNLQLNKIKRIISILLYVVMVLVIFSGLGIAYDRTMEFLSGGLVNKTLSFNLHNYLFIPLITLFALHTLLPALKLESK